jgi:hypothetical protein
MSQNRSLLNFITKNLDKKPSKPKVPRNQWQHPGEVTKVNSPNITMDAVSYPVLGVPNVGQPQMMYPDQQYNFPGASNVTEYPEMQFGGLWDSNRTAWVDSVNNANMNKNFVQRMYNPNAPQMFLPGSKKPSTHYMESGDGKVYPTVVQRPGNKFLEWLNQNDPNAAYNYAMNTGQYIQFPNDEQAIWYGRNGYKTGKRVVTGNERPGLDPGFFDPRMSKGVKNSNSLRTGKYRRADYNFSREEALQQMNYSGYQIGGETDIDSEALKGLGKVFSAVGDVMSIPARGLMKMITGKYQ